MKREVWLVLILGCILILVLEAPAALSSVTADMSEPYAQWEAPPQDTASDASVYDGSVSEDSALERDPPIVARQE